MTHFAAGDFGKASDDFAPPLRQRADVYSVIFRYLSRAHNGEGEAAKAELAENAQRTKFRLWPYAFIELYLGKRSAQDLLKAAANRSDRCLAQFYVGEWFALNGNSGEALALLNGATETCLKDFDRIRSSRRRIDAPQILSECGPIAVSSGSGPCGSPPWTLAEPTSTKPNASWKASETGLGGSLIDFADDAIVSDASRMFEQIVIEPFARSLVRVRTPRPRCGPT